MTQRVAILFIKIKTDCLGHVIDDNGIHTKLDKMQRIRECVSVLKSLLDAWSPTSELLSLRQSNWLEGCWLQLCVAPFPNVYVPNFKLEDLHWRFSVFRGPRVGGLEVRRFRSAKQ